MTPNITAQITNITMYVINRAHAGSRPSSLVGNVCTRSKNGFMRCFLSGFGPSNQATVWRPHFRTGAGSFVSSLIHMCCVCRARCRGTTSSISRLGRGVAAFDLGPSGVTLDEPLGVIRSRSPCSRSIGTVVAALGPFEGMSRGAVSVGRCTRKRLWGLYIQKYHVGGGATANDQSPHAKDA